MRRARSGLLALLAVAACLSDRVVEPGQPLPAVLAVDKPSVRFVQFELGRSVPADTVIISNNGESPLGTIEIARVEYLGSRRDWLATSLEQRPDGAALVFVPTYRDVAGLPPDTAFVFVRSAFAEKERRVVVVARTITGARFEFSANPVTFATLPDGADVLEQELAVRNGGNDTLRIRDPRVAHIPPAAGWLEAIRPEETDSVLPTFTLTARPAGLPPGLHTAWVVFESTDDQAVRAHPDSVQVQLRMGAPRLGASANVVTFSGIRGDGAVLRQAIGLSNVAEGTDASLGAIALGAVQYPPGNPSGWLSAVLDSAEGPRMAPSVVLQADVGDLPAGTYPASLPIGSANGGSMILAVVFEVRLPGLTLSSRTVSFNSVEGGGVPPPQSLLVSNSGSGTVSTLGAITLGTVTFTPLGGWMSATVADSVVTITPTATAVSLPAGRYTATVPIASENGGVDRLTVTLTVARATDPPVLGLSAEAVSFVGVRGDPSPAPQTVIVTNTGGGSLGSVTVGSVMAAGGWLTAVATGQTVSLSAATGSLAGGVYLGSFDIVSQHGGTKTVGVTFTVGIPQLGLSTSTASFGAAQGTGPTPSSVPITLVNIGAGSLASLGAITVAAPVYVGPPRTWLTATQTSGSVVALSATTGSLMPGIYRASVSIGSANGGSASVDVSFSVSATAAPPVLSVRASAVSFAAVLGGSDPAAVQVGYFNSGGGIDGDLGSPTASVQPGGSWLAATAGGGTVGLSPMIGGLPAGVHSTLVTVTAVPGGSDTVRATLTVADTAGLGGGPVLGVSANDLSFSTAGMPGPSPQTVIVSNLGSGSLGPVTAGSVAYLVGAGGWLTVDTVAGNASAAVTASGLGAGNYLAEFRVSASGQSETVAVHLTIAPPRSGPQLTLATSVASFAGVAAPSQVVAVSNTGGGDLGALGTVSLGTIAYGGTSNGWLAAAYDNLNGQITLTTTAGGVPPGTHGATLPVLSTVGGNATLTVSLSVPSAGLAPSLKLSLDTLTFRWLQGDPPPPSQSVTITNGGGGSLGPLSVGPRSYDPGQPTGWLVQPLSGPAAPGALSVLVHPSTLAAGSYTASLPIHSASGGSRSLVVTVEILSPVLTLSTATMSFGATQDEVDPAAQVVTISNTGVGTLASLGALSVGAITYAADEPIDWLTGVVAAPGTLSLAAKTSGLPSGTLTARGPVSSEFGGGAEVIVAFTVAPGAAPPELAVSATEVTFNAVLGGTNPAPQSVAISNQGGQTLGAVSLGAVGPAAPWLSAELQGNRAVFSVATGALPAGTFAVTLPVQSSTAGTIPIDVVLDVGAPRLALSTRTVVFGDTLGSPRTLAADVFVTNSGAGDLSSLGTVRIGTIEYSGPTSGWLSSPIDGQMLAAPIVPLMAAVGELPLGSYHATVPVVSERGDTDTVAVRLVVNRQDPALDRPSIEFVLDDQPTDQADVNRPAGDTTQVAVRVGIRNPANTAIALTGLRVGSAEYVVGGATGWIAGAFLDKTSAPFGAPAELLVAIAPRGLVPGRYEADVPVSSAVAKNSPRRLRIVLTIQ